MDNECQIRRRKKWSGERRGGNLTNYKSQRGQLNDARETNFVLERVQESREREKKKVNAKKRREPSSTVCATLRHGVVISPLAVIKS